MEVQAQQGNRIEPASTPIYDVVSASVQAVSNTALVVKEAVTGAFSQLSQWASDVSTAVRNTIEERSDSVILIEREDGLLEVRKTRRMT